MNNPMTKLTSTKFFLILKEASQRGIDLNEQVLEEAYNDFTLHVFTESRDPSGKAAYRFSLVCTRIELIDLVKRLAGKKCECLP
jgi:hypothetical protein